MNQLHGRIDVWFDVKGSKGKATMRFASFRKTPRGMFETTEWSLKTEDGEWVDLLEAGDPFGGLVAAAAADVPVEAAFEDEDAGGRGYRQQSPYK
jgi:cytochrome c oxidase assembly factor 1